MRYLYAEEFDFANTVKSLHANTKYQISQVGKEMNDSIKTLLVLHNFFINLLSHHRYIYLKFCLFHMYFLFLS
jgi:hypothetical protein